jgi:hypothetical protein
MENGGANPFALQNSAWRVTVSVVLPVAAGRSIMDKATND